MLPNSDDLEPSRSIPINPTNNIINPLTFTQLLTRIQSLPPGPQLEQALKAFAKLYPGRKDLLIDHDKRLHYLNNPLDWVRDKLAYKLWSKQEEIILSVKDNRRTAVPSAYETGKSFISAIIICWWIDTHLPGEAKVITTAPTGDQVKSILWQEIGRTHERGKLLGRLNQTEWWVPVGAEGREELVAFGRKPRDQGTASFQGIHEKYVLVVPDEAAGIDVLLMNQIEGLLGNEYSRLLLPGNPEDSNSPFAKECQPGSKTNTIQISAFDTPNFQGDCIYCGEVYSNHIDDVINTPNEDYSCLLYKSKFKPSNSTLPQEVLDRLVSPIWVEERKQKWGIDSPLYISKVLGQFPDNSIDNLIPLSWVRLAQERTLVPSLPIIIGSDVGGGGDKNVNTLRRGKVYHKIRSNQVDNTMTTLDNCITDIQAHRASQLRIDSIGIGRGASDRAKQITQDQHEVRERPVYVQAASKIMGVEVSSKASKPESFVNLRSEGYWNLRELFNPANGENIDIDPLDDDLANELVNIKYTTSNGRIQIENKKEMKARTKGKSPDNADSLMLASLETGQIITEKKKKAKVY